MNTTNTLSYRFPLTDLEVRTFEKEDGSAWFANNDICNNLEIKNARDAFKSLHEDEKGVATTDTLGGKQTINIISESGLYALIFKSRKASAQKFRKWVTSEVLPAIRQHGKYDPAELAAQMPPLVRRAYLLAQMEELEAEVTRLRAQADMAGVIPGQYTVFQWLLMQGEEPKNLGGLSGKCKRLAAQRGIAVGSAKVIDHCGQITRLSRTAFTYPEEILREICGEAAA